MIRCSHQTRCYTEERALVLAVDDDPQEALRLMEEERPRLVLLDLMLPDADGVDLMQAILEIEDVPVIFISAYGREDLVARAFDRGRRTT